MDLAGLVRERRAALDMEKTLPSFLAESWSRRCFNCLAAHPLLEVLQVDVHLSAARRAKISMDGLLGSLAFAALFFSVDGSAVASRNPSDCAIEQGSLTWYLFASVLAMLMNSVPCILVHRLARRDFVQRRQNWRLQLARRWLGSLCFWSFGLGLSTLHLLIIAAFLANMGEEHHWVWMFSFTVVIFRKLVIVPLLACAFSLGPDLLCGGCTTSSSTAAPKKFGLETSEPPEPSEMAEAGSWHAKVAELAGRGIRVRQLLDFYARLGEDVMTHFDPAKSTTHDVVRQAIIPLSMELRDLRTFRVTLHEVFGVDGGPCKITVGGGVPKSPKPWSSGDGMLAPAQSLLVEEVGREEHLHLCLLPGSLQLEAKIHGSTFWTGFCGEVAVGPEGTNRAALRLSIHPWAEDASFSSDAEVLDIDIEASPARCNQRQHKVLSASRGILADPLELPIEVGSPLGPNPGAREEEDLLTGFSYATVVNSNKPLLAAKMVTHNWGNRFVFLLAAIFSDALGLETYDGVAELLERKWLAELYERLRKAGKLSDAYWVCAFSVNQHAGICATPPATDSTGFAIAPCRCSTPKHFTGDQSEMNKFDDMMAFLKQRHRQNAARHGSEIRLKQVVAMDIDFSLLSRVWCVAELVEADSLHLMQAVKLHSAASQSRCLDKIVHLDVAEANASFPADKDLVLSKIEDIPAFNHGLQNLLLHRLEPFLGRNSMVAANCLDDTVLGVLTVMI
ncbi:SYT4 [Symbiodinium natans]|uniref:SYT4 protein n=1 Tax=Symbiodinium natans TaxID=878477 RepID=A0A812UW18_9DINO|nr:SYT4 [Symbiodinium natans]